MKDFSYKEKNGLFYPEIQISNNNQDNPLGKYGSMCMEFLHDEYPERYQQLLMSGELLPLMHKINDEAHTKIEKLSESYLQLDEYKLTDDAIENYRIRNTVQILAESNIIRSYILKKR